MLCATFILALSQTTLSAAGAGKPRTPTRSPVKTPRSPTTPRSPKAPVPCANANLQPTPANQAAIDTATLCLVNQIRTANHLHPLRFSPPLQSVATGQARDMVRGDYFGDESLAGETPMQRILATPYPAHAARVNAAQNIGWATGPVATPAGMVQAWMASPPHREIILTPAFRDIGVGVTPAAPSSLSQGLIGATYTLEFGQRIFKAKSAGKHPQPGYPPGVTPQPASRPA